MNLRFQRHGEGARGVGGPPTTETHSPADRPDTKRWESAGFTLVEMLVAMGVLGFLLVLVATVVGEVSRAWIQGEQRLQNFQNGRAVLELISRELQQAALSEELQFVQDPRLPAAAGQAPNSSSVFWQAPLASTAKGNLCEVGYYLSRTDPAGSGPGKYQLKRFFIPPDADDARQQAGLPLLYRIYNAAPSQATAPWVENLPGTAFLDAGADSVVAAVSDGIIAFWVRCLDANGDPIPWLSGFDATAGPIKFNSAAKFLPAIPGTAGSFRYTDPATTVPAHRLPSAVELTIVTVDAQALRRPHAVVPALPAIASPEEMPGKIAEFMDVTLPANGIPNARLFSVVVNL